MSSITRNNHSGERKKRYDHGKRGVSFRAIIASAVSLSIMLAYLQYSELTQNTAIIDNLAVPSVGGLLIILLLQGLNILTNKLGKRVFFSNQDLIVVYVALSIGGFLGSWGLMSVAMGNIAAMPTLSMQHPGTYRSILEKMSSLVVITDLSAARGFWVGTGDPWAVPWRLWIGPVISWTAFWLALLLCLMGITTLFRRRWTEHEQLLFPLTTPVVSIATGSIVSSTDKTSKGMWRNGLFWFGTAFPIVITISGLINNSYPGFPAIPTMLDLGRYFTQPPWSALAEWPSLTFTYRPLGVGIGYLLSSQLLFSVWLFYLIQKFTAIPLEATGNIHLYNTYRYAIGRGAFIGISLYYLWLARLDIVSIIRKALKLDKSSEIMEDEPLSYSAAFFSIILGFAFVTLFSIYALNMTFLGVAAFFIIFFGVGIGFARLRAEAGVPTSAAGMEFVSHDILYIFGRGLGVTNALGNTLYYNPMVNGYFAAIPAYIMESYKLADGVNVKRNSISKIIILAFVLTFIFSLIVGLPIIYNYGMFNLNYFSRVHGLLSWAHTIEGLDPNPTMTASYGIGVAIAVVLMWLKTTFAWFGLHPLGVGFATNAQVTFIWGEFFVAWLIKVLILRWAGYKTYRKYIPLFMGLIVGQVIMSGFSSLVDIILDLLGH